MKASKQEIELADIEIAINNKIHNFIEKYQKYPKYLKLPLWVSCAMKSIMKDMEHLNLDYNTELLMYRDLIVCETVTISEVKEIEVF